MRKQLFKSLMLAAGAICLQLSAKATIHTIVTTGSFTFSPASGVTAQVGDTIMWSWGGGMDHTTTSTTIPSGASIWDSPLNTANPMFMYVPSMPGVYEYKCTPHAPGMAGSFTVVAATGVGNLSKEAPFTLCPNPASSEIVVKGDAKTLSADVVDMTGRTVAHLQLLSSSNNERTYSVKELTPGYYMLRLRSENATSSQTLIVAH